MRCEKSYSNMPNRTRGHSSRWNASPREALQSIPGMRKPLIELENSIMAKKVSED